MKSPFKDKLCRLLFEFDVLLLKLGAPLATARVDGEAAAANVCSSQSRAVVLILLCLNSSHEGQEICAKKL